MKAAKKYPFLSVGVTGGIGSGKSTVCDIFSRLGRPVIKADLVAKQITDSNAGVKKAIQREFGPAAYLPDGSLDRKMMAEQVFADPLRRQRLNAIIHPEVFRSISRDLDALAVKKHPPYVLIEAALIYETGMDAWLDCVIVVTAEEEIRLERVMRRDAVSREDVVRRMNAQMPMEKKVDLADYVIRNNGPLSELEPAIVLLDKVLSHVGTMATS